MKPVFDREETDLRRDLEILHETTHYREWLFHGKWPYPGTRIFENGSGMGSYAEKLLSSRIMVATGYEEKYVNTLRSQFDIYPNAKTLLFDIMSISPEQRTALISMKLETVIDLNVLEHIENNMQCLKNHIGYYSAGRSNYSHMSSAFRFIQRFG